jgi:hypothetical protein
MTLNMNVFLSAGIFAFNFLAFLGMAPVFLHRIHHHWIVPAFCGLLFLESLTLSLRETRWTETAVKTVLLWIVFVGAILFWRQFSMFECYLHCGIRLALGLFFLALSSILLWKTSKSSFLKKISLLLFCIFFLWSLAALTFHLRTPATEIWMPPIA